MPDNQPTPPWQLCDTSARTAIFVCRFLDDQRKIAGMSVETLAARSGLSAMSVTRAMHANGCNLAEILCLCAVLGIDLDFLLNLAARQPAPATAELR